MSFAKDTYTFQLDRSSAEFVGAFRQYYGPTMNAFDAAEKAGRAEELAKELVPLFESQNRNPNRDKSLIPATFLRVTVAL